MGLGVIYASIILFKQIKVRLLFSFDSNIKKKNYGKIHKQKPPSMVAFHLPNKMRWRRQCARFTEVGQSPTEGERGNMLQSAQICHPSIPNPSPKVSLHNTPFSTTKLLLDFSPEYSQQLHPCSMTNYHFPHLQMLF